MLRRFDWPAAEPRTRGSMLFLGGRGDFIEKYLEAMHHFHAAGWSLAGFDWRGQGGSGRFLLDRTIGHCADFAPLVDDAAAFAAEWISGSPGPHVLLGHSMGGHLLLRLLAERSLPVEAAVLVAPMLGFAPAPLPQWGTRIVAALANAFGLSERPAWSEGERPELFEARRRLNLTHSPERFEDEKWWKAAAPAHVVGPPTWGWVRASLRSMDQLARPNVLRAVRPPILITATPRDRLVGTSAITRAAGHLPDAELRWFPDGAHELLREADEVRLPVLAAIDGFLDRRAPAE